MEAVRPVTIDAPGGKRFSLEDLAEVFSGEIDDLIRDKERTGSKFVKGEFRIAALSHIELKTSWVMYFVNPNNQCLVLNCEHDLLTMSRLNLAAIMELRDKNEVVFEITAP